MRSPWTPQAHDDGAGGGGVDDEETAHGLTQMPSLSVDQLGGEVLVHILEDMYRPRSWWDCGLGIGGQSVTVEVQPVDLLGVGGGQGGGEEGFAHWGHEWSGQWAEWVEAGVSRYVVEEHWVGGWLGSRREQDSALEQSQVQEGEPVKSRGWDGRVGGIEANKCAPYSFQNVKMSHCLVLVHILAFTVSVTGIHILSYTRTS